MKFLDFVLFCALSPLTHAVDDQGELYAKLIVGRLIKEEFPTGINCSFTGPGATCSTDKANCNKVFICLSTGENEWKVIESNCTGTSTCNLGKCSEIPSPLCRNSKNFTCKSLVGKYPDPADCKKFHFCLPKDPSPVKPKEVQFENFEERSLIAKAKAISGECPENFAYNPQTTYCDRGIKNDECPTQSEVGVCKNIGDTAAVKSNPVLYYICSDYEEGNSTELYPYLYMCPNGKKYKGNYKCD